VYKDKVIRAAQEHTVATIFGHQTPLCIKEVVAVVLEHLENLQLILCQTVRVVQA
jgi:hypothetical protein